MGWYAIFVKTGYEEKVKDYITKIKPYLGAQNSFHLLIPKRKLYERKNGVRHIVFKTMFPGYILIETENIESFYKTVKDTPNIVRFIKNDSYFEEISLDEILFLLQMVDETGVIDISSAFYNGSKLKIFSGPLTGREQSVLRVDRRKGRVKVNFMISGQFLNIDLGIDIYPANGGKRNECKETEV